METITRFTLVCHDTADADALHAVFGSPAGAPLEAALQAFFAARKRAIHPPDGMGFDHYQRMGLVIDAAFTSGSADAADFLQPLAHACRALHAEMVDDEVARRREYGFIDGKKKPPADVAALMQTLAPASQLGRVGRMAEAAARAAGDPTAGLVRAIGTSKNAATVAALLAQGADPNSKLASGTSCLNRAVTNKSAKIVQLLLEHGADPNLPHKGYPNLYEACRFSAPKIVDLLLRHGADPNVRKSGAGAAGLGYPIEIAIYYHQSKAVQLLLDKGARTSGLPHLADLLELTARTFDAVFENLDGKLAIFQRLVQDQTLHTQLVTHRERLTGMLQAGFGALKHAKPKDRQDFDDILAFMAAA